MSMSLADAVVRMRNQDPVESMSDPDLLEFLSVVSQAGAHIMTPLSDDEKVGAVGLLLSTVMEGLMSDGEYESFTFLMSHLEQAEAMMAIALRMSVGLAAVEEWR